MTETDKPVKKRRWTIYGISAMALFILLVTVLLDASGPHVKVARRMKASNYVAQIYTACQAFRTEYGGLPESPENCRLKKILGGDNPRGIEFLFTRPTDLNPNGEMIDPWGTPFRITFDPDSKVHVISAGPDKIFGTADDIPNQ